MYFINLVIILVWLKGWMNDKSEELKKIVIFDFEFIVGLINLF